MTTENMLPAALPAIHVTKDPSGLWMARTEEGRLILARDTRRFTRTETRKAAVAFVQKHAAVEEIARRYMLGELERIPALAAVEAVPGVQDFSEAKSLLDSACAR